MAGIEEAFEKFVTRVSGREKSRAEQPLSKYKSYSEQELLENIEAKYPNQLQSFSQEDYQLNTMPMFEPRDVAPPKSYSPMPVEKYLRGREYMDLAYGGRAGYETGGDVSEEQSLIEKILEGKINIGAGFGNKNKDDTFNKYGFGERDIKDPRLGIEYIMDPGNERSSKIGISVGPKGGGISFMKPFSEKLNEEKNEDIVQTYIDFAKNVWGVEVTEQEARKALGIYDMPDTSIRNELPPEEKAYGGRVSMSDGGLTTTIAPDKGPDSQGVESLFRRRYN